MFDAAGLAPLVLIFLGAAAAVWIAGIKLSDTTDVLAHRLGLGEALAGLIILAFTTNLPEIAITASAAVSKDLGIAIGNILGGIAIQTFVLVPIDAFGTRGGKPLMYRAASLSLVLEGILVVAVLIVAVMGSELPMSAVAARLDPGAFLIVVLWVAGVWLVGRSRTSLPWHGDGAAPDSQEMERGSSRKMKSAKADERGHGLGRTLAVFAGASVVTLAAGIVLEQSGEGIAAHLGISGVLFGATFLAAATALPEVSTGIASARMGDYALAVSDVLGGNAFLPVLFLMASLLSGQAVLPQINETNLYLTGLAVLLTCVYLYGLVFRPARKVAGIGLDSMAVTILYAVGIVGLVIVARR